MSRHAATADNRTPTIPRCCLVDRLEALDVIEAATLNDALATFDDLLEVGWSRRDAVDMIGTAYRDWICTRIGSAVDLAATIVGADQ